MWITFSQQRMLYQRVDVGAQGRVCVHEQGDDLFQLGGVHRVRKTKRVPSSISNSLFQRADRIVKQRHLAIGHHIQNDSKTIHLKNQSLLRDKQTNKISIHRIWYHTHRRAARFLNETKSRAQRMQQYRYILETVRRSPKTKNVSPVRGLRENRLACTD